MRVLELEPLKKKKLTLVMVESEFPVKWQLFPPSGDVDDDWNLRLASEEYLKRIADGINIPGANFSCEVLEGKPADMLADYATQNEVDLILIASHGRSGVSRWVLGSVADRIVRNSCVPVMMVRAPGWEPK